METLYSILRFFVILIQVILVFNLIILVHEWGHFLAARWRGLKVEKFQIWFGKPIWKKTINGVQYGLGWIPAGGFVALPQMAPMGGIEGKVGEDEPVEQLPPIKPLDKIIVAFAGPLFSILLAFGFGFLVWGIGKPDLGTDTRVIGYVMKGGPADGKLMVGDEIEEIDGYQIKTWDGMVDSVRERIIMSEGDKIEFVVKRDGKNVEVPTGYTVPKMGAFERSGHRSVGIDYENEAVVGSVIKGSPGDLEGIRSGDRVITVDGNTFRSRLGVSAYIEENPEKEMTFVVDRAGVEKIFKVTPALPTNADEITKQAKELAGEDEEKLEKAMPKPMVGMVWADPQTVGAVTHPIEVEEVVKGSPAEAAGFKEGDRVLKIDGEVFANQMTATEYVAEGGAVEHEFLIQRGGEEKKIKVTPKLEKVEVEEENEAGEMEKKMVEKARIGLAWMPPSNYVARVSQHPTPWVQVKSSATVMWRTIRAVTSSKSSLGARDLSGPIGIGNLYYKLFQMPEGWKWVLWFSVLLNVNLAILNMLPFPILDGGHIMMGIYEMIFRRPINFKVLEMVQIGCALLLFGFMLFVTFFDAKGLGGQGDMIQPRFAPPKEAAAVPGVS